MNMKQFPYRLALILAFFLCVRHVTADPTEVKAAEYDVTVDGMYYDLNAEAHTATLTYKYDYSSQNAEAYKGDITVPDTITVDGERYAVTAVKAYAFYNCTELLSATLPPTVTAIGRSAFNNCKSLKACHISGNVRVLPYSAFNNCAALTDVTLPDSLVEIGMSAFIGCQSLETIHLPAGIRKIGDTAFCQSGITHINLPDSLREIGLKCFNECNGITEITLPDSLNEVSTQAFLDCKNLQRVVGGYGTRSLSTQCFYGCPILADVYLPSPKRSTCSTNAFSSTNILRLHAPNDMIEAYADRLPWRNVKEIIPLQCTTPEVYCENGNLQFYSSTNLSHSETVENVEYTITALDDGSGTTESSDLPLTASYLVKAVSTSPGILPSDTATVTICWVNCAGSLYKDDDYTTGICPGNAPTAVTLSARNGILTADGLPDGTLVRLFTTDGRPIATATTVAGRAFFHHIPQGTTLIVDLGGKSQKIWSE